MFGEFFKNRAAIENQYRSLQWIASSGESHDELVQSVFSLNDELLKKGQSKERVKAQLFAYIMDHAQLAITPEDFFQDHICHGVALQKVRGLWIKAVTEGPLKEMYDDRTQLTKECVTNVTFDFGHTVPDWNDILALGIPGLLHRAEEAHKAAASLTQEQEDFYYACETVYQAVIRYLRRLAAECRKAAKENAVPANAERLSFCADTLEALACRAPETTQEALQLTYIFHILQEEIEGERLRSLGGLDRLYKRYYDADLASCRFTKENLKELWQDFFQKFHALTGDTLFGEPMYIGGTLPGGGETAVNELTWLIVDAYDMLDIANPKIHVRYAKNTPREFILRICECIRGGNSSFVFISDECAVPMMMKVGATEDEAREYVPVGCYEPGILGREVACTGNGGINLAKMVELALHDGTDPVTGRFIGVHTGAPAQLDTFDKLKDAVRAQLRFFADKAMNIIRSVEHYYLEMNPAPLFSATMHECVEKGRDAYTGSAKYNNSSVYLYFIGTLVDSLAMIQKLVYQNREMPLQELVDILDSNWEGHETLRLRALRDEDKWGNDRELPDSICVDLAMECAKYINAQKNGRGGRFKTAMFTIDRNFDFGKHVGATADGRKAGAILSRNLGASSGMDRNGITALMRSCTKLDLTEYPNGTVLDFMLHPTAVAGEEGLNAFAGLILAYQDMGGYAIHGNVFDAEVLRAAQRDPEKYKNLQVRVCGWNVYFVNLSRDEQDEFIHRAELAAGA